MEVKAILLDMNGVMFDAQNASEAQSQNSKTILKKGVVELIEYAKKNDLKLAVCTEDTKEKCEALFKICALSASQFDLVLSHSEIDVSNTNASFYQTALEKLNTKFEKLNLKTEECLVLVSTYTAAQTGLHSLSSQRM